MASLGVRSGAARFALAAWVAIALGGACAKSVTVAGDDGAGGDDPGGTGGSGTTTTIVGSGGHGGAASGGAPQGGSGAGGAARDAGGDAAVGSPCQSPSDCAPLNGQCTQGACQNGLCIQLPANEFGACDDGLFCTENESCTGGVCGGGAPKVCPGADACHVGLCDEVAKSCTVTPGNDGAQCSDGDPCTLTATCSGGACLQQTQKDCSFLNDTCSVGVCDPKLGCVKKAQADGTACDDGLYCTVNDACKAGVCSGQPNTCAPPGDVCLIGTCDEGQKKCVAVPGNDGAKCASGNPCLSSETCSAGKCIGGVPANDGKACASPDACQLGTTCSKGVCGNPKSLVTQCLPNDGCCPANCDVPGSPDNDCKPAVAVVGAPATDSWLDDVVQKLVGTGGFLSVDGINAKNGTPTAATLQKYGAVLVFSDSGFQDGATLGNNLATYFDGGGRVVIATFTNASVPLNGTFGDVNAGYLLIQPLGQEEPSDSLGVIAEPQSPLVKDVKTLTAQSAFRSTGGVINGGVVVASWAGGAPLIVRGVVKGRNRVDVNLYPPSIDARNDFWSGDGAAILRNALLYK
jgi:hypothetical protein